MSDREPDVEEHVERTDVGVSITAELKRGTGTRDQDKLTVKVKRENYADAREELDTALDEDVPRWSDSLREVQSEGDGDE